VPDDAGAESRAAVEARLRRVSRDGQLALVLEPEAAREAEQLGRVMGDDVDSRLLLGWFHWYRHEALPGFEGDADREAAAAALAMFLVAGGDPDRLPSPLLVEVVNEAARAAVALVPDAAGLYDPGSVDTAVRVWRYIVSACPESHPYLAAMLTNLGVTLRFRAARTASRPDTEEAVACFERAIDTTPPEHGMRAARLFNLGIALRERFNLTEDDEDLGRATNCFNQTLDAMAPDDPERPAVYEHLGATYRVRASRQSFSFEQIAFVEQHLADLHESVYAVSTLITAPNMAAVTQIVRESSELRRPSALTVLDAILADAEALGADSAVAVSALKVRREILLNLQHVEEDRTPELERPAEVTQHDPWADRVGELLAEGRVEATEVLLTGVADRARAENDPLTEGRAEYALHELVFSTIWPAPGSRERMARHAAAAEHAFGRARDHRGLAAALRRLAAVALELHDSETLRAVLARLTSLDPLAGVWWFTYVRAVESDDREFSRAQLRWCVDNAVRLGPDAEHFRIVCESKLAFLDGRAMSDGSGLPAELGALMADVTREGPTQENGERLEAALRHVETMRSYAHSNTVQRGLSAVYMPVYEMLSLCVGGTDPEPGIDVLERNTSRSLLAHIGNRTRTPKTPYDDGERRSLDELLANYVRRPTPQHRRLLTLGFDRAREAERYAERRVLEDVSGPAVIAAPVRVSRLRAMLGDDAVLFFGVPGKVFLITRNGCDTVDSFSCDTLGRTVESVRRRLSGRSVDEPDSTPFTTLGSRLSERVPEGARLFLVPYGEMWRIPLAALGAPRLSDRYRVATVPSLSVLAALLDSEPARGALTRFVGLADPDGSLPHARDEVDRVAVHFPDPLIRKGNDARIDVYRAAADADVVHLACHGFHLSDYPDFSGLRLSGPTGTPAMLWYSDVADTRLTASLVVLGACHAGTGEVLSGSEYIGLPGALLAAGAKSVLAPLWEVDDEITARMMESFYSSYAATKSAALALRQAQHVLGERATAAFQLFGLP
jgi:hypothetical protein